MGDFLANTQLFADVAAPLRDEVAAHATAVRLPAGEWLFHKDDPGDAMYVVRAGRLEVVADGSVVRELGRGAVLGELALLTKSPRSLSVRAARETDLIAIGAAEFERLLRESSELSLALNRTLAAQLRTSVGTVSEKRALPRTIALVPLDERVPVAEIGRRLSDALSLHASAAVLDGSEVERPRDGADPVSSYGPLIDRCEARNDQVVLVTALAVRATTPGPSSASSRPIASSPSRAARPCRRTTPRGPTCAAAISSAYDVVVGSERLAGWAELLDPIESHAVHAATLDDDVERMARRLTGRSLGIVLSGGGARAFSHIGVLEELMAAGMVIDRVAGVSMGAYIGGMFAVGMEIEEIDACCYDEWVRNRPLADYTLPRHSLIRGDRVEEMLQPHLRQRRDRGARRAASSVPADLRDGRRS